MPVGVLHQLPGGTREQYEQVAGALSDGRGLNSLADWPVAGVLLHAAGPTEDGWCVFDVWESEEAVQRFADVLVPRLREAGLPDVPPRIFPLHNLVR